MSNRPRPLYVPDLSRPAGADVDAHGDVTCVACGTRLSVMAADVVGLGYRCTTCSALATPEDDADASLSPSEQTHVPDVPRSRTMLLVGVALLVLATLQWLAKLDVPIGRARSLFVYVVIAGVGCIAVGLANHRKWR